ncbi:MAG TPA: phosphatidylglycerol lysyltransferase domain-containing protein [Feifaniaceae bacterium]|nr:phosphatidylglycerol lysyltransferase domain-containing protein [Feifaniaceae bacterium]
MLEFQPVRLSDKAIIDPYLKPHAFECSEFTFTNFIIWGQDEKIQWAERDGVLYIRLQFAKKQQPFMFPPIPKDFQMDYGKALAPAYEYFSSNGVAPRFRAVSGRFVDLFQEHAPLFSLIQDRDTFDYIYSAEDLITLKGRKYHAKRNHINQFTSQYSFTYETLTPDRTQECMELYMSWLQEKDVNEPGILGEMKAISFLLPNMDALHVKGGCIYVAGKLVAFSMGEQVRDGLAVIHIEKADASYMGLYAVINQQFAEHAWSDMAYLNREEDMGIPGMRKAKLSYQPVKLIEKYDAVLRP